MLDDILPFAHNVLRAHIHMGDWVLDGTAGNGHDTLLLAQCVGSGGKVLAFDIQTAALSSTERRLQANHAREQVQLIADSHANLAYYVTQPLAAAVFNFGYLPNGDKTITTLAETSVAAVTAALACLQSGGVLVAVIYSGHDAGKQEKLALLAYFTTLPPENFQVIQYAHLNRVHAPPLVVAVYKK